VLRDRQRSAGTRLLRLVQPGVDDEAWMTVPLAVLRLSKPGLAGGVSRRAAR
jgi:hypothetical protein